MSFPKIWTTGFKRLLLVLAFHVFVTLPMMAIQVAIDIRSHILSQDGYDKASYYQGKPLYDEILDNIPQVHANVADPLLLAFIIISCIYYVLHQDAKNDRTVFIRRLLVLVTIAYALRMPTVAFTRVPSAVPNCETGKFAGVQFLKRMFNMASSCSDMIFSGHTCSTIILMWGWLYNKGHVLAKVYGVLHALAAVAMFLLQRFHYTVDIILGIYISGMLCSIYAQQITIINRNDEIASNPTVGHNMKYRESFFTRLIRWIELRDKMGEKSDACESDMTQKTEECTLYPTNP